MKVLKSAATIVLALNLFSGTALAQQTIKVALLADPSHEAIVWAIKQGKVRSDKVKIEAEGLDIPALIQSMSARTYDVVETSSMSVPHAVARGLDLRIVGTGLVPKEPHGGHNVWVKKDSAIQKAEDLRGKSLAVYSINSTLTVMLRVALAEALGSDAAAGEVNFVQLPAPATPAALASNRVDSGILIHAQAYQAMKSGEFRVVVPGGQIIEKKFGFRVPPSMLTGYAERISKNPEVYKAFLNLLIESREYALANRNEVFGAVGKATGTPVDFFEVWFREFSDFPVTIHDQDVKALAFLWEKAKQHGVIKQDPQPLSVIWDGALRAKAPAQ